MVQILTWLFLLGPEKRAALPLSVPAEMSDPESLREEIAVLRAELVLFRQETIQALKNIGDRLDCFCELTWTFEDGWLRVCFEGETYAEAYLARVFRVYEDKDEQGQETIELTQKSPFRGVFDMQYITLTKPPGVASATFHRLFEEIDARV